MKKESERPIQSLLESQRDNAEEIRFLRSRNENSHKKVTQASNELWGLRYTLKRVKEEIEH